MLTSKKIIRIGMIIYKQNQAKQFLPKLFLK